MWSIHEEQQTVSSGVNPTNPPSVPFADDSTRSVMINVDKWQIEAVEQRDPIAVLRHTYQVEDGGAVGIDVGAMNIKIVAMAKGRPVAMKVQPTWPGEDRDAGNLIQRVLQHVTAARKALPEDCGAIGVGWSGMVRPADGKLIAWRHWMELPSEQFAKLESLRAALATRFPRARVQIERDAAMSAFAVRVTEGLTDAIVIDVGTDISGARIDGQGNVDFQMPMEIGAMVVAIADQSCTPWAPPGNLTDYASGAAIRRLAQECGVGLGGEPTAFGSLAADSAETCSVRSLVARALGDCVVMINQMLPARAVRFSGGVMAALGKALLPEIRSTITSHSLDVVLDVAICSVDPMFCGALGAAHYANALAQAQSVKDTFGGAMRAAASAAEQASKGRK